MIKRLNNLQINKDKWDEVVTNSDNPHIYLLSWYLDIVSPGWQCLIFDDYKWIMPLPVKHKWGIPYLVQPPFCQKFGVFGIGVKDSTARLFYKKLFWHFPYFSLQIGDVSGLEKRKYLNERINYTLDLTPSYKALAKDFHENTLRNIKKAFSSKLIVEECSEEDFVAFSKSWLIGVNETQLQVLNALVKIGLKHDVAKLLKVNNSKGEIQAAACFLVWNQQILYLAGASSVHGRKSSAMFLIFDNIIKEFSETGYLLDMEGSMIPGVAKFFRGFGGKASYYYHLKKYLFFYR